MEPLFLLSRTIRIESTVARIAIVIIFFAVIFAINSVRKCLRKNAKKDGDGGEVKIKNPAEKNSNLNRVLKNQDILEQIDGKSDSDSGSDKGN
jgi:hypothetical protein